MLTINFQVTDQFGAVFTGSATATQDIVTATATITPATAAAGTTRNITINASSSAGGSLTYSTPTAPGIVFTPVAGQSNQWTFVY
jgi:hypothetical protein